MKILVVYDTEGNIVFTQSNATSNYKIIVADVPSGKEIDKIDAINNKVILRDVVNTDELESLKNKVTELSEKLEATNEAIDSIVMGG